MENNYTVLARKYRSGDFASLIGQDVLVKTLTTAIATDRIAHAYILTGIRGTGKTSTARILAKSLNCLSSDKPTAAPCGVCENCMAITNGGHIDVMEIDAASHTGVDNMRDILDAAQYRPTNGRYKVYIIDEVHMLSTSAFNALLKTLEEPPSHIVFILATTEIRKVPVTILSRCQRFDLARVPVETLKKHFSHIAELEHVELSDAANDLLARAADGSVRDGLSLLDQAIAQTGGHVDEKSVLDMLKRADRGLVVGFMKTLLAGDTAAALESVDEMYSAGTDLSLLLCDMMEWTHWATRMHPVLNMGASNAIPYSADQQSQMTEILKTISLSDLAKLWQTMISAVPEIAAAGNQKQAFDMLVVRLIASGNQTEVRRMKDEGRNKNEEIKKDTDENKVVNETKEPIHPSSFILLTSSEEIGAALRDARELMMLSVWQNDVEIIDFNPGKIKLFVRSGDKNFVPKLSAFLRDKTGNDWVIESAAESANRPTATESAISAAKADPGVAAALDLFAGAEIVKTS